MMGGMVKGKSDPYARISVGEAVFKSAVVKENLNPVWNELYEVCCSYHRTTSLPVMILELFELLCVLSGCAEASVRSGHVGGAE